VTKAMFPGLPKEHEPDTACGNDHAVSAACKRCAEILQALADLKASGAGRPPPAAHDVKARHYAGRRRKGQE
jgi:hypothetical protein